MSACPKCGGSNGFYFDMIVTNHMIGLWAESAQCGDASLTKCGLAKCIDCGAKMRVETAERAANNPTGETK